jgi:pimeloyl-ACP methyl ester carboxylesterase
MLALSGWAQPARALHDALGLEAAHHDYSHHAPEHAVASLAPYRDVAHVVGWSMGGQLALAAIAVGVLKPKTLTLLASPFQFVGARGMGQQTFAQFRANYITDPARTKTRFHGLVAKGDVCARQVMAMLTHHDDVENTSRWLPWLDYLAQANAAHWDVRVPTLLIHGTADAIVPVEQVACFKAHMPQLQVEIWEGCGHAPHLHDAARLLTTMQKFQEQHEQSE